MSAPVNEWVVTECRGRAGLQGLEADWRRLCAGMPERSFFIAYEACAEYLARLHRAPDRIRCLVLADGERPRAICLLEPRLERRLGLPFQVWRVLWFDQANEAEVVCADDEALRELPAVLAAYLRRRPEGGKLLGLGPAPATSALWEGLGRLGASGSCLDPQEGVRVLDCRAPFEQLLARISSHARHTLKAARKKLGALEGVRFVTAREPVELEAAFQTFLDLEAAGWKGAAGTAVRFNPGQPAYYAALAASMRGQADRWEIDALYAGDRCLAAVLGIRAGTTLCGLKIAYDPAHSRISPGQLLLELIIERCCADPGIHRLHLMSAAPWAGAWPAKLVPLQVAYLNVSGWRGRCLIALLKFRLGPCRRLVRRLRASLARQDTTRRH